MTNEIANIARQLGECAEEVCRRYLPAGRREGPCWRVGDLRNTPGRSLFVRLKGPDLGARRRGRWADMATGEYGDLIDLIRGARGYSRLTDALDEARKFLSLPRSRRKMRAQIADDRSYADKPYDFAAAIRRILADSSPIGGTHAETYLRARNLQPPNESGSLRFHPACVYRDAATGQFSRHPALVGLVTNLAGQVAGIHRIYLSRDGRAKAKVEHPRRSLGAIRGHAVRFGNAAEFVAAGEGVETMLAIQTLLPGFPTFAALSASNLAALALPASLRRLYIALDRDAAGARALAKLSARAQALGIQAIPLTPIAKDFNADLTAFGREVALGNLLTQIAAEDAQQGPADPRTQSAIPAKA